MIARAALLIGLLTVHLPTLAAEVQAPFGRFGDGRPLIQVPDGSTVLDPEDDGFAARLELLGALIAVADGFDAADRLEVVDHAGPSVTLSTEAFSDIELIFIALATSKTLGPGRVIAVRPAAGAEVTYIAGAATPSSAPGGPPDTLQMSAFVSLAAPRYFSGYLAESAAAPSVLEVESALQANDIEAGTALLSWGQPCSGDTLVACLTSAISGQVGLANATQFSEQIFFQPPRQLLFEKYPKSGPAASMVLGVWRLDGALAYAPPVLTDSGWQGQTTAPAIPAQNLDGCSLEPVVKNVEMNATLPGLNGTIALPMQVAVEFVARPVAPDRFDYAAYLVAWIPVDAIWPRMHSFLDSMIPGSSCRKRFRLNDRRIDWLDGSLDTVRYSGSWTYEKWICEDLILDDIKTRVFKHVLHHDLTVQFGGGGRIRVSGVFADKNVSGTLDIPPAQLGQLGTIPVRFDLHQRDGEVGFFQARLLEQVPVTQRRSMCDNRAEIERWFR